MMTRRPADLETLNARLKVDSSLTEVAHHLRSLECWVVGGWIRDRALGREPPDLDLVVSGAEKAENAAAILGAAWGTTPRLLGQPEKAVWRLTGPQCKVEIWPLVNAGIEADALRRDYTCNALFWHLQDGPLFDPTKGFEDIINRRIRAISRANLVSDPVRLLRGVRLQTTLDDFSIEPETRDWISDLAPALAEAPRERVGAELLGLARTAQAADGFREAAALNLLAKLNPKPSSSSNVFTAPLAALTRLAGPRSHPVPESVALNFPETLIAWLACGWPSISPKNLAVFSWPRTVAQTVAAAVSLWGEARARVDQGPGDRREFIARCGPAFPTVLALAAAIDSSEGGQPQPWRRWWQQWVRSGAVILDPHAILDTSEVAALTGAEPGRRLGRILRDLRRAAVRRDVRSPEGARRWLRTYSVGAASEPSSSP